MWLLIARPHPRPLAYRYNLDKVGSSYTNAFCFYYVLSRKNNILSSKIQAAAEDHWRILYHDFFPSPLLSGIYYFFFLGTSVLLKKKKNLGHCHIFSSKAISVLNHNSREDIVHIIYIASMIRKSDFIKSFTTPNMYVVNVIFIYIIFV